MRMQEQLELRNGYEIMTRKVYPKWASEPIEQAFFCLLQPKWAAACTTLWFNFDL